MAVPPVFTVLEAMIACGVDNVKMFNGQTSAQRFGSDIFGNDFITSMDKTMDELNQDLKRFSDLTQAQGQIRISLGIKRNIRAFIQWVRDQYRLGLSPENSPFPVGDSANLIRRHKTHKQFVDNSKTLSEASKPGKFDPETKWEDWSITF